LSLNESDADRSEVYQNIDNNADALAVAPLWTPEETELARRWLSANEKTLAALKKAARRRRYFRPLADADGRLHNAVDRMLGTNFHRLARLEAIVAADDALRGRWDAAYEWNLRIHRMADHAYQQPYWIQQMIAMAVERAACEQLIAFLQRHCPDEPAALLREIEAGDDLRSPSELLDSIEGLWLWDYIEAWHEWAKEPAKHPDLTDMAELLVGAMDEDLREALGDLAGPSRYSNVEEVREAIQSTAVDREWKVVLQLRDITGRWNKLPFHTAWKREAEFRKDYCDILLEAPSLALQGCGPLQFSQGRLLEELTRMHRTAVSCAIAIRRFRNKTGSLPDRLEELVPGLLEQVPVDAFSGKPLIYRVTDQGEDFTLYSVGADQVDSGGKEASDPRGPGDQVFWPLPKVPRHNP